MSTQDDTTTLLSLRQAVKGFNEERDWAQFHSPKDLAMALSVEANELLELFLWQESGAPYERERVREELADVAITLLNFANQTGIDISKAVRDKMVLNAERYPVALSRGKALKYDKLT